MTLSDLERLAREATVAAPGPYRCEHVRHMQHDVYDADGEQTINTWHAAVGDYLAAMSPDVALSLLRVVRAAAALEKADIANADLAPGTPIDEFCDALAALNLETTP